MRILWRDPERYLSVHEVSQALDADLAYTTVMTLLTRLHRKGFLERRLLGRAWTYRSVVSQSEHTADTMTAALWNSEDPGAALFRFVERLTPGEQEQLRERLDEDNGL